MARGSVTRPTSAIGEVMTAAPRTKAAVLRPQMDDEPRSSMPSAPAGLSRTLGSRIQVIDVLQRVGQHPVSRVAELTPRLWKQHFAEQPLRSDLHGIGV